MQVREIMQYLERFDVSQVALATPAGSADTWREKELGQSMSFYFLVCRKELELAEQNITAENFKDKVISIGRRQFAVLLFVESDMDTSRLQEEEHFRYMMSYALSKQHANADKCT